MTVAGEKITVYCANHMDKMTQFLGACAKVRKVTICFVMSVCPSVRPSVWNNSALTGRLFMKSDMRVSENLLRKFKFH